MIAILLLILMSTSVDCLCELITENGTYTGLGLYRYHNRKDGTDQLLFYNRNDTQLEFKIDPEGDMSLIIMRKAPWSLGFIFSGPYRFPVYNDSNKEFETCCVTHSKILCLGEAYDDNKTKFPADAVVVNPLHKSYVLAFNRTDKSRYSRYSPHKKELMNCYEGKTAECMAPQFVEEMDASFFSQIEGVVDFDFGVKRGYLVVFNISGRPKYCFTFEAQNISKECNSSAEMRTLYDECFNFDDSIDPLVWVLIALAVIDAILSIAVYIAIINRRKQWSSLLDSTVNENTIQSTNTSFKSKSTENVKGLSKLNEIQK